MNSNQYRILLNKNLVYKIVQEWVSCEYDGNKGYFLPYDNKYDVFIIIGLDRQIQLYIPDPEFKVSNKRISKIIKKIIKNGFAVVEYVGENPFPEYPDIKEQVIPFDENKPKVKFNSIEKFNEN